MCSFASQLPLNEASVNLYPSITDLIFLPGSVCNEVVYTTKYSLGREAQSELFTKKLLLWF